MRRSRPLPIETTAAISFVVVASFVALVVLVRHVEEQESVQAAARSALSTVPEDEPAPPDDDATTTTVSPSPTTTVSSSPPTTSTTSTTSTTRVPATDPESPPAPPVATVEAEPECPGLVSETQWTGSGGSSVMVLAAGGTARYAEVVTNESDDPCTLATNRCGSTAEVRTSAGEPTDAPPRGCSAEHSEAVLEPGEQRVEQLTVVFPLPPGDYVAHIRRYDGTAVDLPVRLDDRLPACAPDTLGLQVNGDQAFRDREEISDSGLDIDVIVTGVPESCTVRIVESRVRLDDDGQTVDLLDETDRWLADPVDIGIMTRIISAPSDVPPGQYQGEVTIILEAGDQLTAPYELLVR